MRRERRPNLFPAFAGALALHAGVFAFALWKWPEETRNLALSAVPVTIVSDAPASAPVISPEPPAEAPAEEAPAETDLAEAPPPPPEPTPPEPAPTPPKKVTPAPAPKATKPAPPKKTPPRKETSLDLDAIAERYADAAPRRPTKPSPAPPAKKAGGALTIGELSSTGKVALNALTDKLQRLWSPNCGVSGADDVRPRVRFTLDGDGRLVGAPLLLDRRADAVWRVGADRAVAAVRRGEPYDDLPDELLNQEITITFRGDLACG